MTVKTISGTYSAGYVLHAPTTVLSITASGYVGGNGVSIAGSGTYSVVNLGTIHTAYSRTARIIGVDLPGGGSLINGSISDATATIYGSGPSVAMGGNATITNFGTIGFMLSGRPKGDLPISLANGGTIVNGALNDTAAIIEAPRGIGVYGAPGTVTNYGTIDCGVNAILDDGGRFTNGAAGDYGARMTTGVLFEGVGTLTNFGTLGIDSGGVTAVGMTSNAGNVATNGSAIDTTASIDSYVFLGGGTVTNFGTISTSTFGHDAVEAARGLGIVTNLGTVITTYRNAGKPGVSGVDLLSGGFITNGSHNDATALISGEVGISLAGGGTVNNYGTITGTYGDAVVFTSAADLFFAEAGSKTEGVVVGDGGGLELASGTGTITGLGTTATISGSVAMTATGFGTYEPVGSWALSGTDTVAAGVTLFILGTLTSTGSLTVAGAITGAGALTIASGAANFEESLNLFVAFTESAGAIVTVAAGDKLTLLVPAVLGGTVNGSVSVRDAKVSGFTIGGGGMLGASGTVTQSGEVTVGDTVSGAANVTIYKPSVWEIGSGSIALGAGGGAIRDFGLLTKNAGTGVSTIAVTTYDDATVEVATGTLDFANVLFGTGILKIDAGATLEADRSAINTLTVDFAGADATLAMRFAKTFAATISGFAASDTLDLLKTKATSASVNGADQLVIVNGTNTVATLQLAGSYVGTTFSVGSDGNGGTDITIAGAASEPPPMTQGPSPHLMAAAMAAMGATAAGAVTVHEADTVRTLMLSRPGAHIA